LDHDEALNISAFRRTKIQGKVSSSAHRPSTAPWRSQHGQNMLKGSLYSVYLLFIVSLKTISSTHECHAVE
jgi:hypothetical protein